MPERPDLEYYVPILHERLRGQRITSVKVQKPTILRIAVKGDPLSSWKARCSAA